MSVDREEKAANILLTLRGTTLASDYDPGASYTTEAYRYAVCAQTTGGWEHGTPSEGR
jgi:hypothetical protein